VSTFRGTGTPACTDAPGPQAGTPDCAASCAMVWQRCPRLSRDMLLPLELGGRRTSAKLSVFGREEGSVYLRLAAQLKLCPDTCLVNRKLRKRKRASTLCAKTGQRMGAPANAYPFKGSM
jgi:hypothetical protein